MQSRKTCYRMNKETEEIWDEGKELNFETTDSHPSANNFNSDQGEAVMETLKSRHHCREKGRPSSVRDD